MCRKLFMEKKVYDTWVKMGTCFTFRMILLAYCK